MIPPLFALFAWPVIAVAFFRKLTLPVAVAVTIVGGYLLLPTRFYVNLPLLPTLDKHSIPAIAAITLALAFAARGRGLQGLLPRSVLPLALIAILIGSSLLTVLTNGDVIRIGGTTLPGMRVYDGFSAMLGAGIAILPLLVARKFLGEQAGQRVLLTVLAFGALAYSALILIELRMSPQMNNWVYGFFPHGWSQHVRASGYRPLVFLQHGLRLSIFLAAATLAAAALSRSAAADRAKLLALAGWLLLMVFASKSLGALLITLVLLPVVLFLGVRMQMLIAAILGVIILAYPMARASGLIPVERLQAAIAEYSPDRAASFGTRLENEEALLDKAAQRPLFGWGGWGRSRILDERGNDVTIADGYWIIAFGVGGWARYLSEFGLLVVPIVLLFLRSRKRPVSRETAGLSLIMIANLVDMIPNSSMTPITWLVAGALWGRVECLAADRDDTVPDTDATPTPTRDRPASAGLSPAPDRRKTPYTRQTTLKTRHGGRPAR
ncbi:MAG: O-antigen ligase family protein [Rhodobacteraceae bacterium HLUCCA08]|nr:MAG: O-antigen ligase family protein [Rhodobacteraceae bacterium HLUCCA08]